MFKKIKRKVIVSIFTSTSLLVSMTGTAFAEITSSSHLDYVALGDSLAAGQTPYGESKTNSGYTDIIANKLDSDGVLGDFNNFGVSGYTTSDVLENLSNELKYIRQAEIVTIDAGANDLLPILKTNPYDTTALTKAISDASNNISTIIAEIKNVNKNAKIYVMGYYNAFPYYPQVQQNHILRFLGILNNEIETAAISSGATYVDTFISMNNSLYLPNPPDIHPNTAGYTVIANDFWVEINSDFIKTSK